MIHLELEVISLKQELPCILSFQNSTDYVLSVECLTIIPRARVGYEMIDSQRESNVWGAILTRRVLCQVDGYNHLISNKREWNNCFTKKNYRETLLGLVDFARRQFNGRYFLGMV